ncbi:MAG: helix-turn-helix transcriptional regulator [Fimbriimonadaceae bacterium]|nr:helix-turn-helix transcriptional regulator [Fimbriimonadaceae bacterium]
MAYLEPIDRLSDNLYVRLFEVARRPITEAWNAQEVRSSYWRLYLNAQDGAWLRWAGGDWLLTAGDVHFVPPWITFSCCCRRPVEHFYVHFDLVGLPGSVVREVFGAPQGIGAPPEVLALLPWALRDDGPSGEPAALLRAKALVHLALASLFEGLDPPRVARCRQVAAATRPVAAALRYIEEHLCDRLPNALLAQLCALSEDHFVRRFRACLGQTPTQYVLERRVANAAQRLAFGDETLERIAAGCGFANRHYFTRVFTQRMGVPPATYRRGARV